MVFRMPVATRGFALLVAAGFLMLSPATSIVQAQGGPTAPVVGCSGATIPLDTDAETDDDQNGDGEAGNDDSDHAPPIVASIKAPAGMKESDRRLAPLAKISDNQARDAALAVIGDAGERKVQSVGLETEQGYVVYAVKTVRMPAGADPKLEVKVDAGNGAVLLIECDPNDD